MDKSAIKALVTEAAQHIKTPQDLSELTRLLTKTNPGSGFECGVGRPSCSRA